MSDESKQPRDNWILQFPALCLAGVYFLGFLVVGRHLSSYGVSTFSLFQGQYLVAGIWAIGPVIAFALVMRTAERFKNRAYSFSAFSWRRFVVISAMTGLPLGFLISVWVGLLGIETFSLSLAARLAMAYVLLAIPIDLAWASWRAPEGSLRWWCNRHAVPFYVVLFAFELVVYVLVFARSVYPLIPASLGGGKPQTIQFIRAGGDFPSGVEREDGNKRSVPYKLLTATDKSYIVISPVSNEESIEIGRDAVEGIVVLKEAAQ